MQIQLKVFKRNQFAFLIIFLRKHIQLKINRHVNLQETSMFVLDLIVETNVRSFASDK